MSRLGSIALGCLAVAALTTGALEVALRLVPQAIPLGLLHRFQSDLRLEIAQRLGLPNRAQTWVIPRNDGGPELSLFKPHSRVEFRYRDPNAIDVMELDANGFCNPLDSNTYAAPTIDVIAVGDSFTWCQALHPEDAWPGRLGHLLGRSAYNLGRGGIGLYEYLQILERFGLPKQPDIVVMNVYEGNDFRDAVRYHEYVEARRRGDSVSTDAESGDRVDSWIGRRSYAWNLGITAYGGARRWLRHRAERRIDFRYTVRAAGIETAFNASNSDADEVVRAQRVASGEQDPGVFDAALRRYVDLAREHDFVPVVAYTPTAYTTYAAQVEFDDPSIAAPLEAYSRALRAYFAAAADEMGFVFIDATPALQAAAGRTEELLYFPSNVHYTQAGHRVLAEAVAARLAPGSPHQQHGGSTR